MNVSLDHVLGIRAIHIDVAPNSLQRAEPDARVALVGGREVISERFVNRPLGVLRSLPLRWYGEYLWRCEIPARRLADLTLTVVATDAAGNTARSNPKSVRVH